ncbi:hypothetical protein K491DRAFT_597881 [Lophiostoma macrostomum CBS 122681]|uniref:FAR-17a/AIG1-like protein n=1 Tax=Lophiostoma macrostomum CBS 122681 TaxID=1314788 RepID=A0A6A6T9R5_9PLEO|nr:hypothetical protein K491DRAFT_597881 [Lophiostoma macrostomum CBS 122681]
MVLSYAAFGIHPSGYDPTNDFVRSSILPPWALACVRATVALYCFTTIIVCYSWLAHNTTTTTLQDVNISSYSLKTGSAGIGQSFSFFTYITFWSLGFYFLLSSIHTFFYALRRPTWLHQWPRILQLLHSLYYTSVTTFPFLVTIVFWGTMYSGPWPEQRFEQWINISVHGLNSVFAITEIVLPATEPPPWTHLPVMLLLLSLYLGLAYLTRWTQGFYVYEWMNPAHGNASIILHIIGYTAGIILIFVLARGAIWLRSYVLDRVRDRRGGVEADMIRLGKPGEVDVESKQASKIEVNRL